jgi:PAS domain S-box-containing protein
MLTNETLDVFDSTDSMMWISTKNPVFTYYNKAWRRFTRWAMDGDVWKQGVHPFDRDRVVAEYRSAFEKRETYAIQMRLQDSQGYYKWFEDRGRPWFEPDGSFGGFMGTVMQIECRNDDAAANRQQVHSLTLAAV